MLGSSSEKSEKYFKAFQELKVREEQLQNPVFADERQTLAMKQIDTVLVGTARARTWRGHGLLRQDRPCRGRSSGGHGGCRGRRRCLWGWWNMCRARARPAIRCSL